MEPYFNGLNSFAEGTFPCERREGKSCLYSQDGRCIYNIAPIQVQSSRACYEELKQDYYECLADYEEGWY